MLLAKLRTLFRIVHVGMVNVEMNLPRRPSLGRSAAVFPHLEESAPRQTYHI